MLGKLYIPSEVKESIKKHLETSISRAVNGYASGFEDEDVLTGQLFGLMKIDEQTVEVNDKELGGTWKWSVDYKKFGGRGKGATESILGADGIFELSLLRSGRVEKKSLLFQSKLDWQKKDEKLYQQTFKLLTWLGAVILINYTEEEFETYDIADVFSNHGQKPSNNKPLQELLGESFLNCDVGDADLHYDAFRKRLIWLDTNNDLVSTKFNVNRRLKIDIKAPNKFPYELLKIDKEISNDDIVNHKLMNENANYGISHIYDNKELKRKQNKISNTFHPDKHPSLPEKEKNILDEMMKGFNNQFDMQKEFLRRRKS